MLVEKRRETLERDVADGRARLHEVCAKDPCRERDTRAGGVAEVPGRPVSEVVLLVADDRRRGELSDAAQHPEYPRRHRDRSADDERRDRALGTHDREARRDRHDDACRATEKRQRRGDAGHERTRRRRRRVGEIRIGRPQARDEEQREGHLAQHRGRVVEQVRRRGADERGSERGVAPRVAEAHHVQVRERDRGRRRERGRDLHRDERRRVVRRREREHGEQGGVEDRILRLRRRAGQVDEPITVATGERLRRDRVDEPVRGTEREHGRERDGGEEVARRQCRRLRQVA